MTKIVGLPDLSNVGKRGWLPVFMGFLDELRIQSKEVQATDDRGTKLDLWGSQKMFLKNVCDGMDQGIRDFYNLKSRQLGITTVSLAIDLFWCAVHPRMLGVIVSDTETNRDFFRLTIQNYYNSLPSAFTGSDFVKVKDNEGHMIFSNGSRIDFLVAGTRKKAWGEGRGYTLVHATEVAKWGTSEGIASFKETFAQGNENRLFFWESTAFGYNHWKEMYEEAKRDIYTQKAFFIGWWSKELNSISQKDPRFGLYGGLPDAEERQKIALVKERYGVSISQEQLAWRRARDADTSTSKADLDQNQPWIEEEAFVQSGHSFFQTRLCSKLLDYICDPQNGIQYKAYRFELGNQFTNSRMYPITQEELELKGPEMIELRVWEEPVEGATYVIGCDPAYGRNDWKDRHCLSGDTEILTKDGWLKYEDVKIGDDAVCFDINTEEYVYGKISEVIIKDHNGPLMHFTSDGLDCLVTPEHRMVTRYSTKLRNGQDSRWRIKTAAEVAASAHNSILSIPTGGAPFGCGIDGLSIDMCRALGWIITDGHCRKNSISQDHSIKISGNGKKIGYHIVLVQAKTSVKNNTIIWEEMSRVVNSLCHVTETHHPPKGENAAKVRWRIGSKASPLFLAWLDKTDIHRIPRRLLTECSREQAEALFLGLLEGDGGWDKRGGTWTAFYPGGATCLADDFQELALRLGYSATRAIQRGGVDKRGVFSHDQWVVRLSVRPQHCTRRQDSYDTPYSGKVWCATVPTGAFVARRNGKVFVTGNCISVWRCFADKMVQAAEYADNRVETHQAAWVLAFLAGVYKNCIVNIELTGPGRAVFQELNSKRDEFRSELYRKEVEDRGWEDFLSTARHYLYKRPDSLGAGFAYHTEATWSLKGRICNQFRDAFTTGVLMIKSGPLVEEMMNVVQDGGEIKAPGTLKDDRVFGGIYALMAYKDWVQASMITNGQTYQAVIESETVGASPVATMTRHIIQNFWKTAAERAENPPEPAPDFFEEHGL